MSIITLTTDFGSDDHYVAAMKGVILAINPRAFASEGAYTGTIDNLAAGSYNFYCDVPGHKDQGMTGTLTAA